MKPMMSKVLLDSLRHAASRLLLSLPDFSLSSPEVFVRWMQWGCSADGMPLHCRGTMEDYAENNLTMRVETEGNIQAAVDNINLMSQERADWCVCLPPSTPYTIMTPPPPPPPPPPPHGSCTMITRLSAACALWRSSLQRSCLC